MSNQLSVFSNNIPYKLFREEDDIFCHWLDITGKRFEEPFFDETIRHCRALPQNRKNVKCISAMSMLPGWSTGVAAVKPAAFIFHISRCGSTLLSQLLSLDSRSIVLSEVPFLDEILRVQYQSPEATIEETDKWLQAAIQFYGQQRDEEQHLFIKTDCWHIFFHERLRKLYPGVPFVLLFRSPDEVLRSQQKRRGMQAVPGLVEPEILGITQTDISYNDFDHYFALVLEKILGKFLQVAAIDPLTMLVNYNEGIIPIIKKIAAFTNISFEDELLQRMEERSHYHAKYPEQAFTGDVFTSEKETDLQRCMQLYQQLEERRKLTASAI